MTYGRGVADWAEAVCAENTQDKKPRSRLRTSQIFEGEKREGELASRPAASMDLHAC
jgi:hypothetical protein